MSKIAVICAQGMGDALIMHIASHNLAQAGFEVLTFSDHLQGFGKWLDPYSFAMQPTPDKIEKIFKDFDAVILQHDNSIKAQAIKKLNIQVYGFYGSHLVSKHGPLSSTDYVCNPLLCMVDNLTLALKKWFPSCTIGKENGLTPPPHLIHNKYPKRIAIHSGSSDLKRNWPLNRYKKIATLLQRKGYDPVFLTKDEAPAFPSLEELASFIYESGFFIGNDSGPGHLASYLQIPSIIIGTSYKHLLVWRPGWFPPLVITPPRWTSFFKWTKKRWKLFIPTRIINNLVVKSMINTN